LPAAQLAETIVTWHNFNLVGLSAAVLEFNRVRDQVAASPDIPNRRCEMKNLPSIAELRAKLGTPSDETVESFRLLKAFLKLSPRQRFEVIELVEQLATDPRPDRRLS
jgi:hypothetical protein